MGSDSVGPALTLPVVHTCSTPPLLITGGRVMVKEGGRSREGRVSVFLSEGVRQGVRKRRVCFIVFSHVP